MTEWPVEKLGKIYDVRDGTHDSPKYQPEGYPLITSKNLKNGGLNFEKVKYISETDYQKINERSAVHKGDILLAMIGTIGNPVVVELEPDFAIKNVALIKPLDNQNSYFLKYYLETEYVQSKMRSEAKGTTQKFVGLGYLRNFPVICPPIPEQKRIVVILDEVFAGIDDAIANTEKNLTNARELFESYSDAVFTQRNKDWKWVSLSDITTAVTDGDHQPPPKSPSGIPFITISNIDKRNRKIDFSDTFKVPPEYFEKLKDNRKPRKGDLLYTVTGSYGIPVVVDHDVNFCFQRHIGLIRPNDMTNPKCLYYMFLSRSLLKQADDCATGTAQKTVSLRALRKFSVPLIPQSVQRSIVDELDIVSAQTFRLEAIYQQKLTALNELKQSILQKAFTGELTADTASQATRVKAEIAV